MTQLRRTLHLIAVAGVGALSLTCTSDELTRPGAGGADPSLAVAGPPARIVINQQPPATALDQEVWDPAVQPRVVVKDAANVGVAGVVVTFTTLPL